MLKKYLFLYLLLFIFSCSNKQNNKTIFRKDTTVFYFDTKISIILTGDSTVFESVLNIILKEIILYDSLFGYENNFLKSSSLDSIALFVLEKAIYFNNLTDKAYDPTLKEIKKLWGNFEDTIIPDEIILDSLKLVRKNTFLSIVNKKLLIPVCRTPDLGGIAKGIAIQSAIKNLSFPGLMGILIEAGGDIALKGEKDNNVKWKIGIQHPRNSDEYSAVITLSDCSICTSGDYQRYFFYKNKRYHHILNPKTLFPSDNAISTTVICSDAGDADALSTAFMVMSVDSSFKLAEKLDIALLITLEENSDILFYCNEKFLNYCETTFVNIEIFKYQDI